MSSNKHPVCSKKCQKKELKSCCNEFLTQIQVCVNLEQCGTTKGAAKHDPTPTTPPQAASQAVTSVVVIEVILQPIERSRFLSWWNCLESQWMISISRTKSWASKSRTRQQLPYYTNPHMRECGAELGARDDFWEVKLRNCTLIQILQKHIKLSFSSKGLQNLFLFIFSTLSSSEC